MQASVKCRKLLVNLSSLLVRENFKSNALKAVCCNYHGVVNNQSFISLKRNQLHNPITLDSNVRFKSKRKKPQRAVDSDNEEEDDNSDEILGKGEEIRTVRAQSLRIDTLFKLAYNISRGKLETSFFENRFRINGEKTKKKATMCKIGDEIDLIKGLSQNKADLLEVHRLEILSAKPNDTMDGIVVKVKKSKSLVIENYPPPNGWKQSEETESQ